MSLFLTPSTPPIPPSTPPLSPLIFKLRRIHLKVYRTSIGSLLLVIDKPNTSRLPIHSPDPTSTPKPSVVM